MKVKYKVDFDEFLALLGIAQMGISSNQVEFDAVYRFCSTSSFFPTTLHLNPTLFKRYLHTYNSLDIYPETLGATIIEV